MNFNIMNTSEIYTSILESFNRKCAWQKIEPENKGRRALILRLTIKSYKDLFIDKINFSKVDYYEISGGSGGIKLINWRSFNAPLFFD